MGQLHDIYSNLLSSDDSTQIADDLLHDMNDMIQKILSELASRTPTAKLWSNYYEYVSTIMQFIRAERTSDWDLHMHSVRRMIPLFHAAGHFAYAKSARLYVQDMENLKEKMDSENYTAFTDRGYFSIRRTNQSWGGNFSDQTIEQNLMRLLKSTGGMSHGRGISDSTLSKWVHSLPYSIPVCDGLEAFTGVHVAHSDQHKDLRMSSTQKDTADYQVFTQWLADHSPFSVEESNSLVSVSTGVVADECVNCHEANEIGIAAACQIEGKPFTQIKLSRASRVINISGPTNTIKVRGQDATINPTLLFMRITCVMNGSDDIDKYLCYELCQQPPSLFDKGMMRSPSKHVLGTHLKSKATATPDVPEEATYVIDGGHLLHTVTWPKNGTYQQVCDTYVNYVKHHYGSESHVIFDGYEEMTTKAQERQRRSGKTMSSEILFEPGMTATTRQTSFLSNSKNKSRLIRYLTDDLRASGITVTQHKGDADPVIVSTALDLDDKSDDPVVVVATDTDILVLLVSESPLDNNIHLLCSMHPTPTVYSISQLQRNNITVQPYLLAAHALSGCDTTSAIYMKGKVKILDGMKDTTYCSDMDTFKAADKTPDDVAQAGERIMLKLYNARPTVKTLDEQRHTLYNRSLSKASLSSTFKLESLPPTSAAAKFHSYRAYHTVQQWIGNNMDPTQWGWKISSSGVLVPIETDKPVAPDNILRMISCGCKAGCSRACSCRKNWLKCSVMCSHCYGITCSNINTDDDV